MNSERLTARQLTRLQGAYCNILARRWPGTVWTPTDAAKHRLRQRMDREAFDLAPQVVSRAADRHHAGATALRRVDAS